MPDTPTPTSPAAARPGPSRLHGPCGAGTGPCGAVPTRPFPCGPRCASCQPTPQGAERHGTETTITPYRILVTGSRTWDDELTLSEALTNALPDHPQPGAEYVIVHGACPRGADLMAAQFCAREAWWVDNAGAALIEERHPADWDTHNKRAGFIRNAHMVKLGADICLAFIRDGSRGATHTADLAEKAGIHTIRFGGQP